MTPWGQMPFDHLAPVGIILIFPALSFSPISQEMKTSHQPASCMVQKEF